MAADTAGSGVHDPMRGKCSGTTCSATQASRLMYRCFTDLLMYSSCKVETSFPPEFLPDTSTIIPPRSEIGSEDAPSILDCKGRIVSGLIPRSARIDSGPTAIIAPVSIVAGEFVDLDGLLSVLENCG